MCGGTHMKVRGQLSGKHTIFLLPPCGLWDHITLSCQAWRTFTLWTISLVPSSSWLYSSLQEEFWVVIMALVPRTVLSVVAPNRQNIFVALPTYPQWVMCSGEISCLNYTFLFGLNILCSEYVSLYKAMFLFSSNKTCQVIHLISQIWKPLL